MTVSVVIPSYRRPDHLRRAVEAVWRGKTLPDEIVVVCREEDRETVQTVAELRRVSSHPTPIGKCWVSLPGYIPAVERGFKSASGDVVTVIDDDVVVTPEWLQQIVKPFSDPSVGVTGGPALMPAFGPIKLRGRPGQLSWYGKLWGNLASVTSCASFEVASVQECNWAWRRELICSLEFNAVLNFDDAAMYGLDLCLQARKKGFRVVFNPQALAYHHLAPRGPGLERADRPRRMFSYCRNYTYIMLRRLPWHRRVAFLSWWFLIGERGAWGLGSIAADTLLNGLRWRGEAMHAFRGKLQGLRLVMQRA